MLNISELWQSAEDLMIQAEYEQAIRILEEIQGFKHLLRAEQLIELKQSFIEAYIKNGQHPKAIQREHLTFAKTSRSKLTIEVGCAKL